MRFNTSIEYADDNLILVRFSKLELDTIRLPDYSEPAFIRKPDLSPQPIRIVFLVQESGATSLITFKSYKFYRVTRSVLPADVIAFADIPDDAFSI